MFCCAMAQGHCPLDVGSDKNNKKYWKVRLPFRRAHWLKVCLLWLYAACAQAGSLSYYCLPDKESAAAFYILIDENHVTLSRGELIWRLAPLERHGSVYLTSETGPGTDDERIVTRRMFRFDDSTGQAYLLEDEKLVLSGRCSPTK